MAKVFKTTAIRSTPITGVLTFTAAEMEAAVTAYWGAMDLEKMFPIAFWKIKRLFNASSTDEVALRVTDIDNPNEVDARWLVFDGNYEEALQDPIQRDVYYFVLNESFFNGPIITSSDPLKTVDGMSAVDLPHQSIVWGRLGKDAAGKVFAFFNSAECRLLGGGIGNDGTSTGFKVPAT